MAENSKIEWTRHTFNPWIGCTKVSPGCTNCYAEVETYPRVQRAVGRELWGPRGERHITTRANWAKPRAWNRAAAAAGERHRVFCASLADVFEDRQDLIAPRVELFHLISETPHLDWLLLTKRPENVRRFCGGEGVPRSWSESMPPNVWLGVSVEDQKRAEERIPLLLKTAAAVRFLSVEPLLGPVDLTQVRHQLAGQSFEIASVLEGNDGFGLSAPRNRIDWVILGGESGQGARPCSIDWMRGLVEQCKAARVPVFVKQLGARVVDGTNNVVRLRHPKGGDMAEWPLDVQVREYPR